MSEVAQDKERLKDLRILVDNNPHVPNRQEAVLRGGEDPGPALAAMAKGLAAGGADFLGDLFVVFLFVGGDDDSHAVAREGERGLSSDTPAGAGYERDLIA